MGATCANHPAAAAIAQCVNCRKPICGQCVIHYQGSIFCCDVCAKATEARGRELHQKLQAAREGTGLFGWLVRLAVLLAVAALVLDYLDIALPYVPDFF